MEILLRQDVAKLGNVGDIVKVRSGYARNYLLPKGVAVALTKGNLKQLGHEKKKLVALEARRKERFKDVAERLRDHSVTIQAEANENGQLYGSVTAAVIAKALVTSGFEVETRNVLLDKPIKEIGMVQVKIRLHTDVEPETKVWVVEKSK